jgi:iron-sulfur cluster assembly protein
MTVKLFNKFLPCTFTEIAAREIINTFRTKNIPGGYGLRIGVKGGGCSGMSYILGFDTQKESDDIFELETFPVFIEKKHTMFLVGVEVDFEDGVNARGFVFNDKRPSMSLGK